MDNEPGTSVEADTSDKGATCSERQYKGEEQVAVFLLVIATL
jgi:hypothetical protein